MTSHAENLVPKVHPATRPAEPEDPMELHATVVVGDPELMLRCFIEEYVRMGWDAEEILGLFRDPFYPVLRGLLEANGEAAVRERVYAVLEQTGGFPIRVTVREEPDPDSEAPELVELLIPSDLSRRTVPSETRSANPVEPTTHETAEGASHA